MGKSSELEKANCLNCGASVKGAFCDQCGQSVRDNLDRSLARLLGEFFGNIFFLDNRFFLSIRHLFGSPGRMTVEFLDGKRKKFISPITLFLFVNLIYFFVSPLSDYSLALYDQAYSQPYSTWTFTWLEQKFQNEALEWASYSLVYQNMSDSVSKSIMILNVPMIAFFIYLMTFKKRKFYFDSLIFAFHFFSLFLISLIVMEWLDTLIYSLSGNDDSMVSYIPSSLFTAIIPLSYAILSIKKFMNTRWVWAIPLGLGATISVALANLVYRFIIFPITLWVT